MHTFHTTRTIEFADTDMAGIVHFARFFVFMETAEHEFHRALGSKVHFRDDQERHVGWPRLEAACRYLSPIRFGDVVDVTIRIKRKGRRALTFAVDFSHEGRAVAKGTISSICCVLLPGEDGDVRLEPIEIPAFLADQLEEAPEGGR